MGKRPSNRTSLRSDPILSRWVSPWALLVEVVAYESFIISALLQAEPFAKYLMSHVDVELEQSGGSFFGVVYVGASPTCITRQILAWAL